MPSAKQNECNIWHTPLPERAFHTIPLPFSFPLADFRAKYVAALSEAVLTDKSVEFFWFLRPLDKYDVEWNASGNN